MLDLVLFCLLSLFTLFMLILAPLSLAFRGFWLFGLLYFRFIWFGVVLMGLWLWVLGFAVRFR